MADLSHFAATLNLLGCCYRIAPEQTEFQSIAHFFCQQDWLSAWPVAIELSDHARQLLRKTQDPTRLSAEYKRIFIGPNQLPAPVWGSYYLDPEKVLQGDSTLRLRQFLNQQGVMIDTGMNEPIDHLGLIMLQAAWFANQQQPQALKILLHEHCLNWLKLFVEQLSRTEPESFYCVIALLTLQTVEAMVLSL